MKIFFIALFVFGIVLLLSQFLPRSKWRKNLSSSSGSGNKDVLEISLRDLAELWIQKQAVQKEKEDSVTTETVSSPHHHEVQAEEVESKSSISKKQSPVFVRGPKDLSSGFYESVVKNYEGEIEAQNATELISELINLLNNHGNCSSVVVSTTDRETIGLSASVRDTLAKVSLMEHTYQVATLVVNYAKDVFIDWEVQVPRLLVAALAHDIGKIPEFHLGHYNTSEHAFISEQKLLEIVSQIQGRGIPTPVWIDSVREAIREHHLPKARGQLTDLLRRADRESRAIELTKHMQDYKVCNFEDWFNVEEFVKKLEPQVNVSQTGRWCALTFNSLIFVRPDCLFNVVNDLREEKKILDITFLYGDDTELVLRKTVEELRKSGLIPSVLKEGFYAVKCKVYTVSKLTSKQQLLIPLRLDYFLNLTGVSLSDIEARKTNVLPVIRVEIIG